MKRMTAMQAIKAKCLECCCGQKAEVKLCEITDCALYEFRLGKNPNYKKKELTEEQKQMYAERAKKMQEARKKKKEEQNGL